MKRKIKTLLAGMLMLAMLVQTFAGVGLEVQADENAEKTYTEMRFSDWGTRVSNNYAKVYKLIDAKSAITSLNGVAVSGTVNFNGVAGAFIRIGGNNDHTGFAFIDNGNCLKVLPQSIGGDATPQTVIGAAEWATLKKQDMKFRAAFDYNEQDSNWSITVEINDVLRGVYNCGNATPGTSVAYSMNATTGVQHVAVTDINTEMKFSDWGTLIQKNMYGTNAYKLIDAKSDVTSLDEVAVSGTVNFNGVDGARIRIGGNNNHVGFAFVNTGGCLKVLPEAIGGDTTVQIVVAATEWATLKSQDFKFRAAFYLEDSNWYIAIHINDELKGTYNCGAATPGTSLAYSINTTTGAQQVTVRDIDNTEMKFSDWVFYQNMYTSANVYKLVDGRSDVTSLDGVAISGTLNFNGGNGARIRIGGKDTAKHGGFAFGDINGGLMVIPEAIDGNTTVQTVVSSTEWATLKSEDFKFRAAFYLEDSNWYIAVYINDEFKGTYNCGAATPGTYMTYFVNTTTQKETVTVSDYGYTELKFSNWTELASNYPFNECVNYLYTLPEDSDITSLDDIAISGTINFNEMLNHKISVGGTDNVKHGGFWLRATQADAWNLSAQGIGTGADVTIRNLAISYDKDIALRMTFDEVATNSWMVCVYADGTCVASKTFANVNPGLYMGIPEDVNVEDKNTVYEITDGGDTYEANGVTYSIGETVLEDNSQRVVVYKLGDANKDALYNVADLVSIKRYTTDIVEERWAYTTAEKLASDLNKDSLLSDGDTTLLREHILSNGDFDT